MHDLLEQGFPNLVLARAEGNAKLEARIDQMDGVTSKLGPSELLRRMQHYCEEEIRADRLPKGSFDLLREALLAGSMNAATPI